MAKTIKEMAMDAYLQGLYINSHDWKEGFIYGANVVLEQIEECLNDRYAITSFYRVEDKINELKGE